MKNPQMTPRPQMRWVPTVDEKGHPRLQAVWETPQVQVRPRSAVRAA